MLFHCLLLSSFLLSAPPPPAFIDEVLELSRLPSVTKDSENLEKVADLLVSQLKDLGFPEASWDADSESVVAIRTVAQAKLRILVMAHFDTTRAALEFSEPAHVLEADHPESLRANDRGPVLSGPGVADDKGGIVFSKYLIAQFLNSPHKDDIEWRVLWGADEESGFKKSGKRLQTLAEGVDLAMSFEPGDFDSLTGEDVFPRQMYGNLRLEWQVHGTAAHAALSPEQGSSAVLALAQHIEALSALHSPENGITVNITDLDSTKTLNVVPSLASFRAGIRYRDTDQENVIRQKIKEIETQFQKEGLRVEYVLTSVATPVRLINPELEVILRRAARQAGIFRLRLRASPARSYGGVTAEKGIPTLESMGPIGFHFHSNQEILWAGSYHQRMDLNAAVIQEFLSKTAR